MSRFTECPCENERPDPCPQCGATVSGDDPVNGVCQIGATWERAILAERERCVKLLQEYCLSDLTPQIQNLIASISSGVQPKG